MKEQAGREHSVSTIIPAQRSHFPPGCSALPLGPSSTLVQILPLHQGPIHTLLLPGSVPVCRLEAISQIAM